MIDPRWLDPAHPERVCWGCDKLCPVNDLTCGNGTERTMHPAELFGEDWQAWRPPEEERPSDDSPSEMSEPHTPIETRSAPSPPTRP
jgi:hypothetical protein